MVAKIKAPANNEFLDAQKYQVQVEEFKKREKEIEEESIKVNNANLMKEKILLAQITSKKKQKISEEEHRRFQNALQEIETEKGRVLNLFLELGRDLTDYLVEINAIVPNITAIIPQQGATVEAVKEIEENVTVAVKTEAEIIKERIEKAATLFGSKTYNEIRKILGIETKDVMADIAKDVKLDLKKYLGTKKQKRLLRVVDENGNEIPNPNLMTEKMKVENTNNQSKFNPKPTQNTRKDDEEEELKLKR